MRLRTLPILQRVVTERVGDVETRTEHYGFGLVYDRLGEEVVAAVDWAAAGNATREATTGGIGIIAVPGDLDLDD